MLDIGGIFEAHGEYKNSKEEIDTPMESDDEDNIVLKRKKRPPKLDDKTDFKKLK